MNDDIAISVQNLGKRYRIRHQQQGKRYVALRDVLSDKTKSVVSRLWSSVRRPQTSSQPLASMPPEQEDFWALRDTSFEIKQGETVGIIGRNGAGKTTLLKLLSRITQPTEGKARIRGRVVGLLEVGTGFHPELTGRENIFLNGAILGMSRKEISGKFDEIVAFADVANFLDTPVKRYSTGMYVRLAFSVAAHLEQEILVVDEVLAVGDAEFQKKCLGKMQNVAKGGRTVLFVSHNMASVLNLCETGILLEQGRVSYQGSMREVATRYARVAENSATNSFQPAEGKPSITSVRLNPQAVANGDLEVEIGFRSPFPLKPPVPGFLITSAAGIPVFGSNARFHGDGFNGLSSAAGVLRFVTQRLPLVSGSYRISVWLGDWYTDYDQKLDVLDFDFRPDCTMALRPPPELIGFLDWPGAWRITG